MIDPSIDSYDVVIAGGGIVGCALALACVQARMRVALVESGPLAGGATSAGMGHVVVMDDSEAQFALTRRSQQLWAKLGPGLPADAQYQTPGTLWIAADDEELALAARKHAWLAERGVPASLLSTSKLTALEPNLRPGLTGALLVNEDAVISPPIAAIHLARQAEALGATFIVGRAVTHLSDGEAILDEGQRLRAPRLVNALGADAPSLTPNIFIRKRKGHLAITESYPGFAHHQLVELGYLKSAHAVTADSVAFNVQPRLSGQILIGSSRQYGVEDLAIDQALLETMLRRATHYLPTLPTLKLQRVWTGFRAATPDKLPLIGPVPADPTLWLATGHEGLGTTTALATAELLVALFTGATPPIAHEPYLPARFGAIASPDSPLEKKIHPEEKQ